MKSRTAVILVAAAGLAALAAAAFLRDDRSHRPVVAMNEGSGFLTLENWPTSPEIKRGRIVYEENCLGCHGEKGEGDGDAAQWLEPPPRNFQKARFKFRSTGSGDLPLEDDVLQTVTCGLPGSSMPGFALVSEQQRRDVVAYVLDLALFEKARILATVALEAGERTPEQILADLPSLRKRAIDAYLGTRKRVIAPAFPAPTPTSIETGRKLYMKSCAACHGNEGRGDGSSSSALRDWQDSAIIPRDFTSGVFRGGSTPSDIFLRIRTGMNGTPMPSTSDSDENVWALIHYIFSTQSRDRIPLTRRAGCNHGG